MHLPIRKRSVVFRVTLACLLGATLLVASGCSKNKVGYTIRPEFSVNVGQVDPGWPQDVDKLSLAEQEMLKMRGKPEMIHIWWIPTGDIVDKMTVRRLQEEDTETRNLSWIYFSQSEEVVFTDDLHWRIDPLPDKLRTVCELGDPQDNRRLSDPKGRLIEKWVYYNYGRIITFIDGMKVSEDKSLQPMPHYMGN